MTEILFTALSLAIIGAGCTYGWTILSAANCTNWREHIKEFAKIGEIRGKG